MSYRVCSASCSNMNCLWNIRNNLDHYSDVEDLSGTCDQYETDFLGDDEDYEELDFSTDV